LFSGDFFAAGGQLQQSCSRLSWLANGPWVEGESAMLWTLLAILLVLWLLGWGLQVAGSLIHLLLLAAVVVLLANLLIGRRAT
jgi:Family of unknown function (DUF5670)